MPNPPPRAALIAPPLAAVGAWGAALYGLGYWYAPRPLDSVIYAAQMTPAHPLMIAAPAVAFAAAAAGSIALVRKARDGFGGAQFRTHLRGTKIVSAARLARMTRERGKAQITIGGVPVPTAMENRHWLLVGRTGSGKSVTFKEMAYGAFRRGDRLLVADANGDLLRRFWKPGDIILNPHDARTVGWSFFNEIRADYDFEKMAISLLPMSNSSESEEWYKQGRLLLSAVARKLVMLGKPSIEELIHYTNLVKRGALAEFLKGTDAASLCVEGAERAFGSARFTIGQVYPAHRSMPKGDFSIRDWLENGTGNMFITWREDMAVSLKPLISAWVDIICTSVLSMPENEDRRMWLMIDELASLGKLPSLKDALNKGRKHGLRVLTSLLSTSGMDHIYGRDEAHELRSSFSSLFVLGAAKTDATTATDMAKALGDHEVERIRQSTQRGAGNAGRSSGQTEAVQIEREPVVLPSQIGQLRDLEGYLALSGHLPIAKVRLKPINFKQQAPGFVARDGG